MSADASVRRLPDWVPMDRNVEAVRAGIDWDAIRVKQPLGDTVLERLGTRTGAVIEDPWGKALYWLVRKGTAATWDAPGSRALGVACWVTVPGPLAGDAGPYWRVPIVTNGVCTEPRALREALEAAVRGDS